MKSWQEYICFETFVVVNFDQHLGAAYSKCWSKYAFSMFFVQKKLKKGRKSKKFDAKFRKNGFY